MYFYLTEQWYQYWSGKLFDVLGKKYHVDIYSNPFHDWYPEVHRWWPQYNTEALMQTGWKCESILFRLILFISPDKTQPIEWPVYQCMRQRHGFQGTLCCLAGTAATNVRQHWYCEASAYVEEAFDFSRVSQCSWSCIKHYLFPFCVKRNYSVVSILL